MVENRIKKIVVVGGGTSGWMAACALANRFQNNYTEITLIESADIGTIGVGEATVPYIKEFLQDLKIDEVDFIKNTNATYKLAIEFDGWQKQGVSFYHPFAGYGARIARIPFHHYWMKLNQKGTAKPLDAYCLSSQIAHHKKFALPKPNNEVELSTFNYAFHFDAALFAKYLKTIGEKLGVKRIEGTITHVKQHADSGFVEAVELDEGTEIAGELFIDCSGFKGLLIEETLQTGYEDWSHWLPCDRAVAMPCASTQSPASSTRSLAVEAGWQWRIPLQHRVGNGYVYSSQFSSDERAIELLTANLEGDSLAEPKVIKFVTGMRKKTWNKNVVALGLSSGFLEPLESTSIYMVQSAIDALINHFPNRNFDSYLTDKFNDVMKTRQQRLRDFIIFHYYANKRHGEPFWDAVRTMSIPDSLQEKIESFRHTGQVLQDDLDFFRTNSWLAMFAGFGIQSERYHPAVDNFAEANVQQELDTIANSIQRAVQGLPSHADFIRNNCAVD